MKELSLFTGGGGGVLATQHLLGWETIGYVEWDDYCQRLLAARINDGFLSRAPIYGNIDAFIRDGYATAYSGLVDVITAGFPCQPFSVAGKQLAADDPRNKWPATIECIRLVRPRYCLLENVPGLISNGYIATVLGDLAACGYDARWRVLSAAELGAPHKRDRLWIVAYRNGDEWCASGMGQDAGADGRHNAGGMGEGIPHVDRSEQGRRDQSQRGSDQRTGQPARDGETWPVADTGSKRLQVASCGQFRSVQRKNEGVTGGEFSGGSSKEKGRGWWATEPNVG